MLRYNVLITIGTPNDISNGQRVVEKKQVDGIVLLRDLEHDRLLQYLTEIHFPGRFTQQNFISKIRFGIIGLPAQTVYQLPSHHISHLSCGCLLYTSRCV